MYPLYVALYLQSIYLSIRTFSFARYSGQSSHELPYLFVGVLNLLLRIFTENFLLGIFMSTIDDEWLKNTCLLKQGSDTHTKTFITWFLWVKFSEKFEIATEMPFRDRISLR